MNDKEPSSPDDRDDGSPPPWVRWGCTALLVVAAAILAVYMLGI